jgi:hypothetical protein
MGTIGIVISFAVYPLVLTASHDIINYAHIATFTGLASVAGIGPLVIFVMMLFGGGFMIYEGAKNEGTNTGMKGIIETVGGLVTTVIMLLLFPTILAAAYAIVTDSNITDFTGLASVGAIAPLIIYVMSLFGGALLSWTGMGKPGKGKLGI